MKQRKLLSVAIFAGAVAAVIAALLLIAQSGEDTAHHTQTVATFDSLARSETELDRDMLEVIAEVIPNYDPLVMDSRHIHGFLAAIQAEAGAQGTLRAVAPWNTYQSLVEAKLAAADHIKRIAAFTHNEENYLPLAVDEYAADHGPPAIVRILNSGLVLVLSINVPDDLEVRLETLLVPIAPAGVTENQGALVSVMTHMRKLAEQRRLLRDGVDAYFAVPTRTAMVTARNLYMEAYASRQTRILWLIRGILGVSVGLFGALGWLFLLLARADRQNEQARRHMRKLNAAVEQSPITILITDKHGAIEYANPCFTQLTGYSLEEVLGQNPRMLKSAQTLPETSKELWTTISTGNTWQGEMINRKKDGSLFIEHAVISPITDETGEITHYIAMKEDITRLRRNEEMLADANVDIERLLSAAWHDLQEPLRTITIHSQLFQRQLGEALPSDARETLHTILAGTTQMRQLVSGLARFARVSRSTNGFVPVNCDGVIAKLIGDLRHTGATFQVGPLPVIQGDAALLFVMFENLVGNGLKFQQPDVYPRISITASPLGNGWQIAITDNGIGIPAEYLPTLIRPFSRLHPRSAYPGAGLGLTTAMRIVKLHGGKMTLTSVVGQGTTVHLWLPDDLA